jgi:hypothetical protein
MAAVIAIALRIATSRAPFVNGYRQSIQRAGDLLLIFFTVVLYDAF